MSVIFDQTGHSLALTVETDGLGVLFITGVNETLLRKLLEQSLVGDGEDFTLLVTEFANHFVRDFAEQIDIVVVLIADAIPRNITVRCVSGQRTDLTALEQSKEISDVLMRGVVLGDAVCLSCCKAKEDGSELFHVFVVRCSLRS